MSIIIKGYIDDILKDVDTSIILPKFFHWLLVDKEVGIIRYAELNCTKKSILKVAELFQDNIDNKKLDIEKWKNAMDDYTDTWLHTKNDAGHNAALMSDRWAYLTAERCHAAYRYEAISTLDLDEIIYDAIKVNSFNYAANADDYKETYDCSLDASTAALEVANSCPFKKNTYKMYTDKLLELVRSA